MSHLVPVKVCSVQTIPTKVFTIPYQVYMYSIRLVYVPDNYTLYLPLCKICSRYQDSVPWQIKYYIGCHWTRSFTMHGIPESRFRICIITNVFPWTSRRASWWMKNACGSVLVLVTEVSLTGITATQGGRRGQSRTHPSLTVNERKWNWPRTPSWVDSGREVMRGTVEGDASSNVAQVLMER